jgi:hypothetical protein
MGPLRLRGTPQGQTGACGPGTPSPDTVILGGGGGSSAPAVVWGFAAPDVAHVVVVLSDGSKARARAVAAGNQKYFALAVVGKGLRVVRWTAYDSSRHVVASGTA